MRIYVEYAVPCFICFGVVNAFVVALFLLGSALSCGTAPAWTAPHGFGVLGLGVLFLGFVYSLYWYRGDKSSRRGQVEDTSRFESSRRVKRVPLEPKVNPEALPGAAVADEDWQSLANLLQLTASAGARSSTTSTASTAR